MSPAARGIVKTTVYRADGTTPLELTDPNNYIYRDIMVGTKLTLIVDSNVGGLGYWASDLTVEGGDVNYGQLFARDFNENNEDYEGSHFEAAGPEAVVWRWEEPDVNGFSMYTDFDDEDVEAGNWFVIDYNAIDIGDCNVVFYQNFEEDHQFGFTHVPTRDFNGDTVVDFEDFGILASYWRVSDCNDPNWCHGADLDIDGWVDPNDLGLFADYWLEKTR
jgi:hypothetical protein